MMAVYVVHIQDAAARPGISAPAGARLGYLIALGLIGLVVIAAGYVLIEGCNYLGNLWDGPGGWTVLVTGLAIAVLALLKHNGGVALFGILVMVVDLTGLIFHLPALRRETPAKLQSRQHLLRAVARRQPLGRRAQRDLWLRLLRVTIGRRRSARNQPGWLER